METIVLDKAREEVSIWLARPYQLVSLLEMITFNAHELQKLTAFLSTVETILRSSEGSTGKLTEASKGILSTRLEQVDKLCEDIGLELSSTQINRVKFILERPDVKYGDLTQPLQELDHRIHDELRLNLFMAIPKARAAYYEKADPFGAATTTNFPSAGYDIQEAGNCLATGRYTACVMHLMRSLEVALDAIGLGVGVPNAVVEAKNSWETLLRKIGKQIEDNDKTGDPNWNPKRSFFVDAHAHLFTVKNAWRNPSMHLEKKYDDREAERIFRAVQDLIEHLATHLDESGLFTP